MYARWRTGRDPRIRGVDADRIEAAEVAETHEYELFWVHMWSYESLVEGQTSLVHAIILAKARCDCLVYAQMVEVRCGI